MAGNLGGYISPRGGGPPLTTTVIFQSGAIIGSGQVGSGALANAAVVSGNIASGQIGMYQIASGVLQVPVVSGTTYLGRAQYAGLFFSGSALATVLTEEAVSGPVGVVISQSGNIRTAMASVSGRSPAVGVVMENVASGIQANVYTNGFFQFPTGHIQVGSFSGGLGLPIYLGRSGAICAQSGGLNSGGLLSGDVTQVVGYAVNSGAVILSFSAELPLTLGSITSGNIASGQIGFPHLADASIRSGHFASGQIITFHLGSGAVLSGNIASGSIGVNHLGTGVTLVTSGSVMSGYIGNQAVVSGSIASGQIFAAHIASGGVLSGNIASGQIGTYHLAAGVGGGTSITSGTTVVGRVQYAGFFFSGSALATIVTEEYVSGPVGVMISQSGYLRVAMASISGRNPAIGVVSETVASGIQANVYTNGFFQLSGNHAQVGSFSGGIGGLVYLGRSGAICAQSGGLNSGGLLSGDTVQVLGYSVNSGAFALSIAAELPLSLGLLTSGNIASGQIGYPHLADSSVMSGTIASGSISQFHLANASVRSGHVQSGQLSDPHFTSGALISDAKFVNVFADNTIFFITAEAVSGVRAVCMANDSTGLVSGLAIAMAAVSGRMPAIGVVFGNVAVSGICAASGTTNAVYTQGTFQMPSGNYWNTTWRERCVYVGRSGQLVTYSGSWNSGGWLSGDILQPVGIRTNSGGLVLNMGFPIGYALSGGIGGLSFLF